MTVSLDNFRELQNMTFILHTLNENLIAVYIWHMYYILELSLFTFSHAENTLNAAQVVS